MHNLISLISYQQNVCQKEEEMGNRLLTALAGLFVSNSDEDIRIKLTDLEPGWQIKGCTVKVWKHKFYTNFQYEFTKSNSQNMPFVGYLACFSEILPCQILAFHLAHAAFLRNSNRPFAWHSQSPAAWNNKKSVASFLALFRLEKKGKNSWRRATYHTIGSFDVCRDPCLSWLQNKGETFGNNVKCQMHLSVDHNCTFTLVADDKIKECMAIAWKRHRLPTLPFRDHSRGQNEAVILLWNDSIARKRPG